MSCRITVRLSDAEHEFLVSLVQNGEYLNISEAIRDFIRYEMRRRGR